MFSTRTVFVRLCCLSALIGLVLTVQMSNPPPSHDAPDQDFINYLSTCAEIDPRQISPQLLSNYRTAIQSLFMGGRLPKVCWMAPGEANDLGWSYQEFKAVNVVHYCFGAEAIMKSSVTQDQALEVMESLIVNENCQVLFPTSFEFIGAIDVLAPLYPDIIFVSPVPVTASFTQPNVRTFAINGYEGMYLMGYLTQQMNTKSDIGGVTSAYIVTELQGAYAYWVGIQDAAAETGTEPKTWHLWFTESFSDVDKAVFATQDLIERFDIDHVSQTVDPYEPQVWLRENGYTGTGTIADMGLFVGETTLGSLHVRWDIAGLNAYSMLVASGGFMWTNPDPFLPCNAWIGGINYGTLSPLVPDEVVERVIAKYAFFQSSPYASYSIWCGANVEPLLQPGQSLDENGCMSFDQIFSISIVHPGIDHLGAYVIDLNEVTLSEGIQIVEGVLLGLSILILGVWSIVFFIYKNTTLMKLSSFKMTMISLLGCLISLIGLSLYIPDANDVLCRGAIIMYAIGFYTLYSALASRIYGFMLIKKAINNMYRAEVGFFRVAWLGMVLWIIGITFTTAWAIVNSDSSIVIDWLSSTELDKYEYRHICHITDQGQILLGLMFAYGIFLAVSVLLVHYALSTKWIAQAKIDSQRFSMVSWMVIVTASVALVLSLALDNNQSTLEVILFFCPWLSIISIILFYYGPNVWTLLRHGDITDKAMQRTTSAGTNRSNTSTSKGSTPRTTAERGTSSGTLVREESDVPV